MRFSTAIAVLLLVSSCELPMTGEFNHPLDAKSPAGSSTKVLREFAFAPGPGSGTNPPATYRGEIQESGSVTVTVPTGTDRTNLVASFSFSGASIKVNGVTQVSGSTKNNFSTQVVYTITATDGSTKNYTVSVTTGGTGGTAPTGVSATPSPQQVSVSWLPVSGSVIAYNVYWSMAPGVTIGNGTKADGVTSPWIHSPLTNGTRYYYVVTAVTASGESPPSVEVNAMPQPAATPSSSKDINSFTFPSATATTISAAGGTTGTIAVTVPAGTDISSVAPTVSISGVSIAPVAGTPRDFRTDQTYTVTAEDGSTKIYTVTVTVVSTGPKITLFKFPSFVEATVITETGASTGTIEVTVPFGTDRSTLTPTIGHDAINVNPPSGIDQDFTSNQNYIVTSLLGAQRTYAVTVSAAPKPVLTSFSIGEADGIIGTSTVQVNLAASTSLIALVPTFTTSAGAEVRVGSTGGALQTSGVTDNDFTSARNYFVTDKFGTPVTTYSVRVGLPTDVTVTLPTQVTVTLSESSTTSWTLTGAATREVSIIEPSSPNVVGWYLDGTLISGTEGQTSFTVNAAPNTVSFGPHSLMAVILSNGLWYSTTTYFTVN